MQNRHDDNRLTMTDLDSHYADPAPYAGACMPVMARNMGAAYQPLARNSGMAAGF